MKKVHQPTWLAEHLVSVMNGVITCGVFLLVIMFINFNTKVAEQTKTTQDIVKSQNDILQAIRQQAIDNKLTSEQKTSIIICMLQVPVNQRSTAIVDGCRKQAEVADPSVPKSQSPKSTSSSHSVAPSTSSSATSSTTPSTPASASGSFFTTTVNGAKMFVNQLGNLFK